MNKRIAITAATALIGAAVLAAPAQAASTSSGVTHHEWSLVQGGWTRHDVTALFGTHGEVIWKSDTEVLRGYVGALQPSVVTVLYTIDGKRRIVEGKCYAHDGIVEGGLL